MTVYECPDGHESRLEPGICYVPSCGKTLISKYIQTQMR